MKVLLFIVLLGLIVRAGNIGAVWSVNSKLNCLMLLTDNACAQNSFHLGSLAVEIHCDCTCIKVK